MSLSATSSPLVRNPRTKLGPRLGLGYSSHVLKGNGRVWTGLDVYHLMDIRLTALPKESDALSLFGHSFSFFVYHRLHIQKPFFVYHDTTVSPTHRVMEP